MIPQLKGCSIPADLPGLPAVVSCHLDSPGWTGYQFQLQPLARPATRFKSLLTGSDCGVRQPQQPPPHDIECGAGQQGGREARVDLVLQTPGSALAAGVVVGECCRAEARVCWAFRPSACQQT